MRVVLSQEGGKKGSGKESRKGVAVVDDQAKKGGGKKSTRRARV